MKTKKLYIIKDKDNHYLYQINSLNRVTEHRSNLLPVFCTDKAVAMVFTKKYLASAIARYLKAKVEEY